MPGLPTATLEFLADLDAHNDDAWFRANRDRYLDVWLAPARELVDELAGPLRDLDADLTTAPRVGAGIRRVQRDRRFTTADPYKPYLDLMAWHGDDPATAPSALWLRVHHDRVEVATGARRLEGEDLHRHRDLVADPDRGAGLVAAVATARRGGADLPPADLAGPPRTHPTDDAERVELLRRRSCLVVATSPPPGTIATAAFVPWLLRRWQTQLEVHRWLVEHRAAT